VFEMRVQACQQRREDHLHVYFLSAWSISLYRIVGKGIHSQNHIAKLKPAIENLCVKQNFKYYIEENEGRILVKFGEGSGYLTEGEASDYWKKLQGLENSYASASQPQNRPPQQYQQQQQYQTNQSEDLVGEAIKQAAPVIIRKLRQCCIIM